MIKNLQKNKKIRKENPLDQNKDPQVKKIYTLMTAKKVRSKLFKINLNKQKSENPLNKAKDLKLKKNMIMSPKRALKNIWPMIMDH